MSKIHGMMDTGKRSMMNSQTALQTAGHNIANKGTEGFSRQRVEIQTAEPTGFGPKRVGSGSQTGAVTRVNNPYLEKQIGKEQSNMGLYKGKTEALARVEQVYNEQVNKGLNVYMSEFFNAFSEFSNNPESLATRTQVVETANFLTRDFKRTANQLREIQGDVDQQIMANVNEVNDLTREIAVLNEKVVTHEMSGGTANDERDRRDLLIKRLGEKVNIRWGEGKDGSVTITAGNSALMVSGNESKVLEARATPETDSKGEGAYDIFYKNTGSSTPVKVTDQLTGGMIGGLLEVRDKNIEELVADVDMMAFNLSRAVNEVHMVGYDGKGRKGVAFFEPMKVAKNAAMNMTVNEVLSGDVTRLVGAGLPNAPGDNRVAAMLASLQDQSLANGSASLDDFYNSMVGKVGIQSRRAEMGLETQENVVKQLKNIRESVSGVSLDEETTKLIEFQKAFDASARLIRTADEMFDTVLNLKRM